ncbi:DUF1365 domain-containing protein [Arcobacter acticola]|jgi:uncharacterized protein|uniref:DUF1365 domain-containing protein n=1 Tax=Arcobacter acticola TaxID=1849015 RepID=A0A6M8EL33_9BACT|nr:DUF1365 domain-containing protein [Arcobacter acticola]QKE28849.1 DUF1365 domain-containing protein [Arcobacter acticola]
MKNLTKHKFYEGTIYHKRFHPKVHEFKYNFYLLDIDLNYFENLKNSLFSINKLNFLSFKTKDHFGKSDDFLQNVDELLEKFSIKKTKNMRFFTLPRVLNFVFNPISALVVFDDNNQATHLLAEVHNYNNGRVVYPILLEKKGNSYVGKVKKDMYVSPFFKTDGVYEFQLKYDENKLFLKIDLFEDNEYKLTAIFNSKAKDFNKKSSLNIFLKYMFSTFLVVTRTYIQAIRLFIKGLKIHSPREQDKERRY